MNEQNYEAQLRYLEEAAINVQRDGLKVGQIKDGRLPVYWNGDNLCMIAGTGNVLYREKDISGIWMQSALKSVSDIAKMTAEYMGILEHAPQLKADGLTGDYRILADFGDAVLAGHPTERGVQFVTWRWDQDRKGVHQGNYFDEDYKAAKQDFAIRSHLIPKDALFDEDQIEEIYYELTLVYDQGEHRPFMRQYELEKTIAQIARLLPEISGQEQTMGQRF